MPLLTEQCRIPTSGARAVEPITLPGLSLLAIPQLAHDVEGAPPHLNGGDSATDLLLLRRTAGGYAPFQTVPAPGGEDAEFFRIGERAFLAVASIRTGSGPYDFTVPSPILEWDGSRFVPFQTVTGYAAKQWRHLTVEDRHFLALAQGVVVPGQEAANRPSEILEWDGTGFRPFQTIPSRWAYNWHAFDVGDRHFLAHADNVDPSVLYRWSGAEFVAHQELAPRHGRAFADFTADGEHYLLVGCLQSPSRLLRWDGARFVEHQELDGPGARELAVITDGAQRYVVRVDFVLGTPDEPRPILRSRLYRWHDGRLDVVEEFPTTCAVDVAVHREGDETLVIVANALGADLRFAASCVEYRFG